MRALRAAEGGLEVVELPDPEPAGDDVLVEVAGAGINRADLLQAGGGYPAPPGWPADVLGLEMAGTVAAVGERVQRFRPGDRVYGIVGGGGHATHCLTRQWLCAPVPEGLDPVAAGGVPEVFVTAHDALVTQAGLRSGERVLINGVGSGVGSAAVQLVRALGATSIGTSRTPAKLERAVELGLDHAVEATGDWESRIGEVDVVLELVGGAYLETDVRVCAPYGRIVVVGLVAGSRATADLSLVMRKRLCVRGTTLRGRPEHLKAAAMAAFEAQVNPLLERGAVRPVIDRVVTLEQAAAGYDALRANEVFGKVVIAP